jgi:hypothetical protein
MRIRSVKPEFFTDRVTGRWSFELAYFYSALWCLSDDEGRFEWEPEAIRGQLFPYRSGMNTGVLLEQLRKTGRAVKYVVDGQAYGWLPKFKNHQHPNKPQESKLPSPEGVTPEPLPEDSGNTPVELPPVEEGRGEERRGEERITNSSEPEEAPAAEPPAPDSPVVALLPVVGGGAAEFPVTEAMVAEWTSSYPGIDVRRELARAVQWARDNPTRRKTARGARKFLGSWLGRAQDRSAGSPTAPRKGMAPPSTDWTSKEATKL